MKHKNNVLFLSVIVNSSEIILLKVQRLAVKSIEI